MESKSITTSTQIFVQRFIVEMKYYLIALHIPLTAVPILKYITNTNTNTFAEYKARQL